MKENIGTFEGETVVLNKIRKEMPFCNTAEAERMRKSLMDLGLPGYKPRHEENMFDVRLADIFDDEDLEEVRDAIFKDLLFLDRMDEEFPRCN